MKLAKEGYSVITYAAIVIAILTVGLVILVKYTCMPLWLFWIIGAVLWLHFIGIMLFFREPTRRTYTTDPETVFSSVDGTVVVVEEVYEKEFLKERCIQVSVFMSIFNIHANWSPVGGRVVYRRDHPGRFLVAWHPKSSEENERTTTVVDTGRGIVLFRQIAGFVARRIVNHVKEGDTIRQNSKFGFIKFGSRIDIFLPIDSQVLIGIGDKVRGGQTPVAKLKK